MIPEFTFTRRAVPFCEIGLGDSHGDVGVAQWDVSRWDQPDARWAGTEPWWLDVSCHVFDARYTLGRRRATDRFQVGTAQVTFDNRTGWADPGDPQEPQVLELRAGRQIRFGVDHGVFGRVVLWRGYIDELEPRYDPSGFDTVEVAAICALGEVSRAVLGRRDEPVGAGERAGLRVRRILDQLGWPQARRDVHDSSVHLVGTRFGGSVADLLAVTADSCGGAVWGDTEGRVGFRGKDWQVWHVGAEPDGVIGNAATSAAGGGGGAVVWDGDDMEWDGQPGVWGDDTPVSPDVCPVAWEMSSRRRDIVTRVELGRSIDDEPHRWFQPLGRSLYGVETYSATDLDTRDVDMLDILARRLFRTRGWRSTPRVDAVTLDAATDDKALDMLTTTSVFTPSRYTVYYRHPSRGMIFNRQMFVTGITAQMSPDRWHAKFDLDVAAPWQAIGSRWDDGRWGQGRWGAFVVQPEYQPIGA